MVTVTKVLTFRTSDRRQLVDITRDVSHVVADARIRNGFCLISAPHATAAIIANENEHGLVRDILAKIEELFPSSGHYAHNAIDDNADSHVAATFLGHSKLFPITNGEIVRGTWQNIFFVELDGPRSSRRVDVQIIGEN